MTYVRWQVTYVTQGSVPGLNRDDEDRTLSVAVEDDGRFALSTGHDTVRLDRDSTVALVKLLNGGLAEVA